MPLMGRLAGPALGWALSMQKLWVSIHTLCIIIFFNVSSGPALLL